MRFDPGGITDSTMWRTIWHPTGMRALHGDLVSGGVRCARPPANIWNPSGMNRMVLVPQ